jgi:SAM-dependent methyltransferase
MAEEPITPEAVAAYYDRNTRRFLNLLGSGEDTAAIHRQIWTPGVRNGREAFETLNRMVLEAVQPCVQAPGERLLDLGCGIGGTTTWVASRLQVETVGVTLSARQAEQALQRARRLHQEKHVRFVTGDFQNLPKMGEFKAAWAIEAYIHATEPALFFAEAARVLTAGGRLVVADDFLSSPAPTGGEANRWLVDFRAGWHVPNLASVAQTLDLAASAGFRLISDTNLTPYLRTVPGWLVQAGMTVLRLPLRSVFWESLRGSTALQACVRHGWTQYHKLIWEKP